KFVDGTSLVNWIRSIKSNQEIEYIKRAAGIATEAMYEGINKLKVGIRESDVVGEIVRKQIQGTPEYGGNYPSIVTLLPSGEKTDAYHMTRTEDYYQYE